MLKQGNVYMSHNMKFDEELFQNDPAWKFEVDEDTGDMLWYGYDSPIGYKKEQIHGGEFAMIRLRWLLSNRPSELERLLDEHRLQEHLDDVQDRATTMLLKLIEHQMEHDEEYLKALEAGDVIKQIRLRNNYELCFKEIVREECCYSK